jgi:tetratricopeptide (TPR) repeat protein
VTNDHYRPRSNRLKRSIRIIVALVVVGGGWSVWHLWARPAARAERLLTQARSSRSAGDASKAEQLAADALELNPTLAEAAMMIAELNHRQLHRLSAAEQAYLATLELDPDNIGANMGLVNLLALCARRREAVPYVLRLVRLGVATDDLVLLARESGVVHDPGKLELARKAAPDDPNPLVGLAWHESSSDRNKQAIELLQEAIQLQPDHAAAHVAMGQQLLKTRRFSELARWSKRVPPTAEEFAETWCLRARLAEEYGNRDVAIRCYWEAVRRAPELKAANFNLARLLADAGESEDAEQFAAHVRRIHELDTQQNRVLYPGSRGGIEPIVELAKKFEAVGRYWEAYGWCRMAVESDPSHENGRRYLEELRSKVEGIPLQMTIDAANVALAIELSNYPLPQFRKVAVSAINTNSDATSPISFRNDAATAGLRFRFFNGTDGESSRRMFEFTGGGIGVLDFDMDGFPDVFFTQGRHWPTDLPAGDRSDRLFRNRAGARFEDVTISARIREDGFGQGVAVGDFNSDGFPDLLVANIGANRLWMNQGDGTFTDATSAAGLDGDEWTTSCVLADFDGDGLSDIYFANYLTAEDVFKRVCTHADGTPRACSPFHFDGQPDRLWINDGNGRFTDATADVLSARPNGKGLGVAVWDAHGTGRLSLFVANDTTPNFFFANEGSKNGGLHLRECGIETGLALNENGKAEGCMGVALGDVDEDGQLDVHVTNFLSESNTLFKNTSDGQYADRTRALGLHFATYDVLGFGTQFLDSDLDGVLELFVANGHVDDLRETGRPYRMLPRLFRWDGRQFQGVHAATLGPYFRGKWLGRSVARIDWNRDGRNDLIVGHLADDSALLTNTTPDAGRFLSIRLIGVESSRDAIGTTVQVRFGDRTIVRQLTAGDGYQASNERRLIFGVGDAEKIDELTVRWPSGREQRFRNVSTQQEMLLTEQGKLLSAVPSEY